MLQIYGYKLFYTNQKNVLSTVRNGPKMALERSKIQNFSGGACPHTPLAGNFAHYSPLGPPFLAFLDPPLLALVYLLYMRVF